MIGETSRRIHNSKLSRCNAQDDDHNKYKAVEYSIFSLVYIIFRTLLTNFSEIKHTEMITKRFGSRIYVAKHL
jgi:hypothetical protein